MKINLSHFEALEAQKNQLKDLLKIDSSVQVDIGISGVHALNDVARGLANLHPHKRSIAVLGAQPGPIQQLVKGFASEGFVVQELPVSFAQHDDEKLAAAWEALKKDTLFTLCSQVEPLTGGMYPFEWVRTHGPAKQIFTLVYQAPSGVSHELIIPKTPFEAVVADPLWGESIQLALILKGERCHGEPLLWGQPVFSDESIKLLVSALKKHDLRQDRDLVLKFEKQIKQSVGTSVKTLGDNVGRHYDRAVLFISGTNGEALVHKLGLDKISVTTGAACYWESPHINSWLPKLGFSVEDVQNSLMISLEELKNPNLASKLIQSIQALQERSKSL